MIRLPALILLLPGLLLTTGCFRANYTRTMVNEPLDEALVSLLERGDDLQFCLDNLGAPIRVWEKEAGQYAMAFGWRRERGWGLRVSVPFQQFISPSFSYGDDISKLRGAVLFFDREMKLVDSRMGLLSDLVPPRRRPVDVEFLEELERGAAAEKAARSSRAS